MPKKEELESLTESEKELLKSFQDRIDDLYRHERYVYKIVRRIKRLRKILESGDKKADSAFEEINGNIKALKSEILERYNIFKEDTPEEEKIIMHERRKRQDLINIKNFLINAHNQLLENSQIVKGEKTIAEKKINRKLRNLKKEIREGGMSINENIFALIEKLHEFKNSLYNLISYEYELLDNIIKVYQSDISTNEKTEKLEDIENRLRILVTNIKKHLRTEKNDIYKPLMGLIGEEISGLKTFQRLKQKKGRNIIKLNDIKKDIYTMSDTFEILEYVTALKSDRLMIEESAIPHLDRYESLAREIVGKIRKRSIKDPLTGLFTRGLMDAQLDNLILASHGKANRFSIMMIDIDNFKSINDTFGHPTGDNVLSNIAGLIRSIIRGSDIACRYGGEEFVIIMPRTGLDGAVDIAEELRKTVQNFNFDLPDKRQVTISLGVASYDGESSKEELIKEADKNLYKAKLDGKNKVIS
ncbi:diguanylate cyclase [Candidatus Woesearchaeota archaeon]|nr:diguanylate cyclase [Candidatus Woesearchaeota archaeon]